jgi:hypothetical protein
LTHKKAVGGDDSPTAIQDMEMCVFGIPEVPELFMRPCGGPKLSGIFFKSGKSIAKPGPHID